jgi:hypothetical protein
MVDDLFIASKPAVTTTNFQTITFSFTATGPTAALSFLTGYSGSIPTTQPGSLLFDNFLISTQGCTPA